MKTLLDNIIMFLFIISSVGLSAISTAAFHHGYYELSFLAGLSLCILWLQGYISYKDSI